MRQHERIKCALYKHTQKLPAKTCTWSPFKHTHTKEHMRTHSKQLFLNYERVTKKFFFKLKNSWGNVLPINNLKVKWKIPYFKVDSWLKLHEGLSPPKPQDGKEGEKIYLNCISPGKIASELWLLTPLCCAIVQIYI